MTRETAAAGAHLDLSEETAGVHVPDHGAMPSRIGSVSQG